VSTRLQVLGVIRYSRGKIVVLDRETLNNCVALNKETDRLRP